MPRPRARAHAARSPEHCPSGSVTASGMNAPSEIATMAFDGNPNTKWLDFGGSDGTAWLQIDLSASAVVSGYSIVSANNIPDRDPKTWEWVVDGVVWYTETNVFFSGRKEMKTFRVPGLGPGAEYPVPAQKYRLNILELRNTAAANSVQLADLVLLCGVPGVREEGPVACSGRLVANWPELGGGGGTDLIHSTCSACDCLPRKRHGVV